MNARYTADADQAAFERRAWTTADRAATVIVTGIRRGRRRVYVGFDARMLAFARRLAPLGALRLVTWGWRRMDPGA